MSRKITAVATLESMADVGNEQQHLTFRAIYDDSSNAINKEWAKYTPALSVSMVVIDSVAENFLVGKPYVLTFEEQ